jgi:two-component system sensor histidine kinase QseC
MTSLKSRITRLVLVCLALIMLPLVALGYVMTMDEVDELFDARLAQDARTISALAAMGDSTHASTQPVEIANWRRDKSSPHLAHGHPYETQIGFQYWSAANALTFSSENLRNLPLDAAPAGFADIHIEKRHWRVFTLLDQHQHWIRVGERYDSRREISRAMAVQAMVPFLIGLPILALVIGWAVRRGVEPLDELADRLALRRTDSVEPIGISDSPREMIPVVAALNGLLGKLRAALEQEREFTAHAAHELRTPLAVALVHVENARAAASMESAAPALDDAHRGLTRLNRIVNQMLELARWDAEQPGRMATVDLDHCVNEELQDIGMMASDKDIEILVRRDAGAHLVHGWEPGLRTLIRNLLDNAIRYNVQGGRVDVGIQATQDGVLLSIADGGPGIEPALRASMFQRFRRGEHRADEGSGLGLSLVARVAQLHRATISLLDADGASGLRVDVAFPPMPRPANGSSGLES